MAEERNARKTYRGRVVSDFLKLLKRQLLSSFDIYRILFYLEVKGGH